MPHDQTLNPPPGYFRSEASCCFGGECHDGVWCGRAREGQRRYGDDEGSVALLYEQDSATRPDRVIAETGEVLTAGFDIFRCAEAVMPKASAQRSTGAGPESVIMMCPLG
jgi:hypothetical protein